MTTKTLFFGFLGISIAVAAFAGGYKPIKVFELSSDNTTLAVSVDELNLPHFEYFGKKLSNVADFVGAKTQTPPEIGVEAPLLAQRGGKQFLEPALELVHGDGDLNTELKFSEVVDADTSDPNVVSKIFKLKDAKKNLFVNVKFTVYKKQNVFTESVEIVNGEDAAATLKNFASGFLNFRYKKYYLTHLNGSWADEARVNETQLTRGIKTVQSRKLVRTTLTENPAFMLSFDTPRNERIGEVVAGALAWSGSFKLNFEYDEFGMLNVAAGAFPCEYKLKKGESFTTPELIFTYSDSGAGQASRNLHNWARECKGLWAGQRQRPLLLNCWEGVSFNVNEPVMFEIMDDASDMGAELYVMDDGWFGEKYPRDNEHAGLGDWCVNKRKLPNGLAALADYAVKKGMKFGIWIEPEMVNPKSELAEKHPDWIVHTEGREIPQIRNQWLLDLSNPDVQDFVFAVFDNVMKSSSKISYVKWDCNRHLEAVGSLAMPKDEQERFYIKYVEGLYNVYKRIRAKYPNVIIQACGSGGGRIDYGCLKYNDEFWGSDNTNSFRRLFIQFGESLFYPAKAMAAHVAKAPNRNFAASMKFRSDVAMTGRFGIEMRPKNLSASERADLKRAVKTYKSLRGVVADGDLYRLINPDESRFVSSLMYVDKDKKRAVFFAFAVSENMMTERLPIRLDGLVASKRYKVREVNTDSVIIAENGKTLSGDFLMSRGITPKFRNGGMSCCVELTAVE